MADHSDQFAKIFGIKGASWYFEKAKREASRYSDAESDDDRTDALLNFSSTILTLEDWTSSQQQKAPAEWRSEVRSASQVHTLFALIALVAKHRVVNEGRFRNLEIHGSGQISIYTEEPSPQAVLNWVRNEWPQAKIISVRTHVDDDSIVAYFVRIEVVALGLSSLVQPVEALMATVLTFWEEKVEAVE